MKTGIAITLSAALVIAAGYIWINSKKSVYVSEAPPSNISDVIEIEREINEVPVVETKKMLEQNAKERWGINVEYPAIVLATAPSEARQANDVILGFVERMKSEFLTDVREANTQKNIPENSQSDLTVRFSMTLTTPSLISVRFERSAYIAGAAHPDSGSVVLNYDIQKHALLSPADLFIPGGDYLGFLSAFTRDKLKQEFRDLSSTDFTDFVVPGTSPSEENFRQIAITRDGLTVIFNPYQVAPYARGVVNVGIPISEAKSKLLSWVSEAIESANATSTPISKPEIILSD